MAKFGTIWNDMLYTASGGSDAPTTLMQPVVMLDHTYKLCSPLDIPHHNVTKNWKRPFILMMKYNHIHNDDCTAVTKVRIAQQQLGAAGVLFVSAQCVCGEPHCETTKNLGSRSSASRNSTHRSLVVGNGEDCLPHLPALLDDTGSASDITIPAMLMTKSDGDGVYAHDKNNSSPLVASMAWHMPQKTTVTLDYWHSIPSRASSDFLTNLSLLDAAVNNVEGSTHKALAFTPHFPILNGQALGCHGKDADGQACFPLCTNQGRYCAPSSGPFITGAQVVEESLRRICIHHHSPVKYWKYIEHFTQWCLEGDSESFFANSDCLNDAYKHSEIDKKDIDLCMQDSGDLKSDEENVWLQEEMVEYHSHGITTVPTLWLNGLPLPGWASLTPQHVFQTMCAVGYLRDAAPHACYACGRCGDPVACVSRTPMACHADDGIPVEPTPTEPKSKRGKKIFWSFFFLSLVGFGGFVYYKKYILEDDGFASYTLTDALMSDTT